MYDHAFTKESVRAHVRRIDFHTYPAIKGQANLAGEVVSAVEFLKDTHQHMGELIYELRNTKVVVRTATYRAQLALRKIDQNLKAALPRKQDSRESIVISLKGLLAEGVPYRLYKLDVRKFYESFPCSDISNHLRSLRLVSNATCRVIDDVLVNHMTYQPAGLPRGLAISSTLADSMMANFDANVLRHKDVFFYRRYVDDLTLITSQAEDAVAFTSHLETLLPDGLKFKDSKYYELATKKFKSKDAKSGNTPTFKQFDYLGYCFNVAVEKHRPTVLGNKEVWLDIGSNKVCKIKTRLMKSFLSFLKTNDFDLLRRRIRHLTSNMSLLDRSKGVRRVIGIHYNYPLVDLTKSVALHELDKFLQNAIYSNKGRIYSRLFLALSSAQKSALAKHSFYAGAKGRYFFQMSVKDLEKVQRCWKYV